MPFKVYLNYLKESTMRFYTFFLKVCASFFLLLTIGSYSAWAAQTLTVGKPHDVKGFRISSIYVQAVTAEKHSHGMHGHKMEDMEMGSKKQ